MPSNEQRRQAAKRKLERQLTRRAERAKRRRLTAVLITVAAVIIVGGGVYFVTTSGSGGTPAASPSSAPTTPPVKTSSGPCKYATVPAQPPPSDKNVGLPSDPAKTPNSGTVEVTLKTNQGDIPLSLNRAEAPCTVQSALHLVSTKFYDNTPCHRMTAYTKPGPLDVLQCGDPTGTGGGGPGYGIPDEKPKTLKPAPAPAPVPAGRKAPVVYPAGTIAMANSGRPGSGGSQFFLVYADTQLSADYTVFGTVSPAGMQVLAKIAAGGIIPGQNPNTGKPSPEDGKPKLPVTIQQATTTAAS